MSAKYEHWDTNPAYEHRDPSGTYRCSVCSRLTMDDFVSDSQLGMGICESDVCMEVRISQLLADELDAQKYEAALQLIAGQLVPKGGDLNLVGLNSQLIAIVLIATHELNNAADRRKS